MVQLDLDSGAGPNDANLQGVSPQDITAPKGVKDKGDWETLRVKNATKTQWAKRKGIVEAKTGATVLMLRDSGSDSCSLDPKRDSLRLGIC